MPVTLAWEDDSGAEVSAIFDIDTQETHELANVITEHPVEEGADVADHVRPQLKRFQLEGFVSDTPLLSNHNVVNEATFQDLELQIPEMPMQASLSGAISAGVSAIGNAFTGGPKPLKVKMLRFDNFKSRKRAAFEAFEDARINARLVRVITSVAEYENMLIEQVTVTRSPDDCDGATFSIALKEIRLVVSDIVVAPEPAELSGQLMKAAGAKSGKDDKEKIAELKKSLLVQAGEGLGLLSAAPGGF